MATRDTGGGQQKATRTREETEEVEASVDSEVAERHKEMTEDIDAILDEIDALVGRRSDTPAAWLSRTDTSGALTVVGSSR